MVWEPKAAKLVGFNGSGRSPKALPFSYSKEHAITHIPPRCPLPVSVPGTVDARVEPHAKFGTFTRS